MDRNVPTGPKRPKHQTVALRKESVDRNREVFGIPYSAVMSLSARRAWIEIMDDFEPSTTRRVALRKESVDRNSVAFVFGFGAKRRSPQGERG